METEKLIQQEINKESESLLQYVGISKSETEKVNKKEEQYAQKLSSLGFENNYRINKLAQVYNKNKVKEIWNEQLTNIKIVVEYYRHQYPLNKVIPLVRMLKICEKYNLVCGNIKFYKEDIPIKTLEIIEKFKKHYPKIEVNNCFDNLLDINDYAPNKKERTEYYADVRLISDEDSKSVYEKNNYLSQDFFITAPKEHFVKGRRIKQVGTILIHDKGFDIRDNYLEIKERMKRIAQDPVIWIAVKFPLRGGACLIVDKYGKEAEYPEFINESDN